MIRSIYNFFATIYYYAIVFRNILYSKYFIQQVNYLDIPIIINNRNRITFLKMQIEALHDMGYKNITILDNASTYKPLLDFYKITECKVIFLGANLGYDALEKIPLYNEIRKNYFVYSDSDVVPVENCPADFLKFFKHTLERFPKIQKVGFSLKIDDLPNTFHQKDEVISWESQFFNKPIDSDLYLAPIDTTFALHRPYARISTKGRFKMIRTRSPYTAYHMPWYNNSTDLTEEEKYYINHVEIGTHWSRGLQVQNQSIFKRILKRG